MAVTGDEARTGTESPLPQQRDKQQGGQQEEAAQQAAAPPAPAALAAPPKKAGWKEFLLDVLERAGWTAGQVFFATILAGGTAVTIANLPWKYASVLAVSAAVASAVLTLGQYATQKLAGREITRFWPDLLLRLAKTFLASLAGSFAAAHPFNIVTFHWTTALNLAAVAVLTSLGKGLLARSSDPGAPADGNAPAVQRTPSTLPTRDYLAVQRRLADPGPAPAG